MVAGSGFNKNKKIAVIDSVGIKAGMNCYDLGLLNALQQSGIQAFLFSNFTDDDYSAVKQYKVFLNKKKNAVVSTYKFLSGFFRAASGCKKNKVEWAIMHVFSATPKDFLSFKVVKYFGINIIAIIHDVNSLSGEDKFSFRNKMYAAAKILVVQNETSEKEIVSALNADERKKLTVIPHGNYVNFVRKENNGSYFNDAIHFNAENKYLLFFGQIKKVKGLDVLLKAMAFLPDNYKLIIAGKLYKNDFDYYDSIIRETKTADRIIKFIRFITDDERDFLFRHCDALVLPYRKIFQSGVMLLSMSYGLPVIASDLPATEEVIEDGYNGMLFEDGNAEMLAEKTLALFNNKLEEKIKTNMQLTITGKYSWTEIASKYIQAITTMG